MPQGKSACEDNIPVRCPNCKGFNTIELFVPPPKYHCRTCRHEWD